MNNVVELGNHRIPTESLSHLKSGDGGGTFEGMSIIDAKIEAAEARTDTKFAGLKGSLDLINERLDNIKSATNGLRLNVWLAAATALGLGVAAMSFGASQFGNGVMVTTAAVQDSAEAKRIAQENAEEVRALRTDLGTLIQTIRQERTQPGMSPFEPWQSAPAPNQ